MIAHASDVAVGFGAILDAPPRIGVTELSRSADNWRRRLASSGVLEVTDRSGTAAYLVSEDSMRSIAEAFAEQEQELEQLSIAAMFDTRGDDGDWLSGDALSDAASEAFMARFADKD